MVSKIIIEDRRQWVLGIRRLAVGVLLVIIPISIGILTDSGAMQWAGFVGGIAVMAAYISSKNEKDGAVFRTFIVDNITEARAVLDQIERESRNG